LQAGALLAVPLRGEQAIYLPELRRAEVEVQEELLSRREPLPSNRQVRAQEAVRWAEPQLGMTLTDAQRKALVLLFEERLVILTGGPGVGKTTIVRVLSEVFLAKGWELALAAPTGRAARRLAESCSHPASTLHRLLKYKPQERCFEHDRDNPLRLDVLLIDEASMMDLLLMRDVLRALPRRARLVLIGDADQLPSVGPGDVLRSLVESGVVPTARLQQILRQRADSTIVRAAHAVLAGEEPSFDERPVEGAFLVERDDPDAAQRSLIAMVTERLPARFALDPLRDVQVLTPMHRGPLGCTELNRKLKAALNPATQQEGDFTPGDRVLQTRNDYDLEVFNGEIGTVLGRDLKAGTLQVDFGDRRVDYPAKKIEKLTLAFCITVHKSQGCEFPAVVLVLGMQHFLLLKRNLLYTALTRARRLLVVVASRRALRTAVEAGEVERRRSLLEAGLRDAALEEGAAPS
jgi:exodeoxyribonuclease V alpha subunit